MRDLAGCAIYRGCGIYRDAGFGEGEQTLFHDSSSPIEIPLVVESIFPRMFSPVDLKHRVLTVHSSRIHYTRHP